MPTISFRNLLYFRKNIIGITEGGNARDSAFNRYFDRTKVTKIRLSTNKVLSAFTFFYYLYISSYRVFFLHYPGIGISVSDRNWFTVLTRKIFKHYILHNEKNKFVIDVADLPVEQSIDLKLFHRDYFTEIEGILFKKAVVIIVSSLGIQKYLITKYPFLSRDKFLLCENGAPEFRKVSTFDCSALGFESDRIRYVYAGTLNPGRSVLQMIEVFPDDEKYELFLMGNEGDWLRSIVDKKNIRYLGNLPEDVAMEVVTRCDVGLIPYDQTKLYYNLAYPTKLAFYLSCGIPFLSTEVQEIINWKKNNNIGYTKNIDNWNKYIKMIDRENISEEKKKIIDIKSLVYWDTIIERTLKLLMERNY